MRGLRWPGGRRPERSLREHLRPRSMAAMRRRFPIADCDHGEARWSRKMDECEGRISARELVARRRWASVRSSATPVIQDSTNLSEKDDGLQDLRISVVDPVLPLSAGEAVVQRLS